VIPETQVDIGLKSTSGAKVQVGAFPIHRNRRLGGSRCKCCGKIGRFGGYGQGGRGQGGSGRGVGHDSRSLWPTEWNDEAAREHREVFPFMMLGGRCHEERATTPLAIQGFELPALGAANHDNAGATWGHRSGHEPRQQQGILPTLW
jgi:hypothetical protein